MAKCDCFYIPLFLIAFTTFNSASQMDASIEKLLKNHPEVSETVRAMQGSEDTVSKWSSWSQCDACQQHRMHLLKIHANPLKIAINQITERACRRAHCQRIWHKKRSRTRMRIVRTNPQQGNHTFKYFAPNSNVNLLSANSKKRIWSKWSTWSKCNASCETYRYKVCRKPGRCFKGRKYESAHCYHPETFCENYVNGLFSYLQSEPPTIPPTTTTTTTTTPQHYEFDKFRLKKLCGRPLRKYSMLKIKGGRNAHRPMWPWHVAIVNARNEVFCSGTLIAPRWILTAGHCIKADLKVRINEYDLTRSDGEIEIRIIWAKRHSHFNTKNIDHDIGLLYMQRGVKTPVACLPTAQPNDQDQCSILGWGAINSRSELGFPILQEAKIPIVDHVTCKSAYASYFISANMFCAGLRSGLVDTCAGDSGGGLMCPILRQSEMKKRQRVYVVQGITSFGEGCGKRHRYGIYTNVANYYDWIRNVIQNHQKYVQNRAMYARPQHRSHFTYFNNL